MFSHVMLGANDLEASKKSYDALLGALDIAPGVANQTRYFYRSPSATFGITTPIDGEPAFHGNEHHRLHGYVARTVASAGGLHHPKPHPRTLPFFPLRHTPWHAPGVLPHSPYTLPNASCTVAVAQHADGLKKKEEQSA